MYDTDADLALQATPMMRCVCVCVCVCGCVCVCVCVYNGRGGRWEGGVIIHIESTIITQQSQRKQKINQQCEGNMTVFKKMCVCVACECVRCVCGRWMVCVCVCV